MRAGLAYNASRLPLGTASGVAALLCYTHDGRHTAGAWLQGHPVTASGAGFQAVGRFGGGNLAIPFWAGNTYHGGDVAELIAFKRDLSDRVARASSDTSPTSIACPSPGCGSEPPDVAPIIHVNRTGDSPSFRELRDFPQQALDHPRPELRIVQQPRPDVEQPARKGPRWYRTMAAISP